jgi:hypothetical protein
MELYRKIEPVHSIEAKVNAEAMRTNGTVDLSGLYQKPQLPDYAVKMAEALERRP